MKKKLTVKDLFDLKGKRKLTELTVNNPMEAEACEEAGIDIINVAGGPKNNFISIFDTNKWFKGASTKDIRAAAPNTFMIMGLGMCSSIPEAIDGGLQCLGTGADAIYIGNSPSFIEALTKEGIPCVSHVGLIPYKSTWTGGFKAVGKTKESAKKVYDLTKAYDDAGAIAVEMECVPYKVAEVITKNVKLLTLSMGSGSACDAQFLFIQDIIGTEQKYIPRHAKVYRDLSKKYLELKDDTKKTVEEFVAEVTEGKFPEKKHLVEIEDQEFNSFLEEIK